jgi:large subunit ribosomal protein L4e
MKLPIINTKNNKTKEVELPSVFSEAFRPDLIKRSVLALQSAARQAYGADPRAGQRHSSDISKRRRKYRGCYGFGISRVNRKILSRRGTRMYWVGATSPQTRGGRRSHPPKAQKIFEQEINTKENRKAIRSAIAATVDKKIVQERGHKIPEQYPFVLSDDIQNITKTKEVTQILSILGFQDELDRSLIKKIRAGLGTLRNRRYKKKKGVMVVVSESCPLSNAANNIPGVEVVIVNALNAQLLAPGALAGRVTLFTESALNVLNEKKLFQ